MVTPYYPPEPGACATRVSELARAWVEEGHEVHVLTGMPCYPDGVVKPGYQGKLVVHEERMGVRVHRSWVNAQPNATTAQRVSYYGSFFAPVVLLGLTGVSQVDVVVATSPHIVAAVAGAVVAKLRGTPLVVEIRDVWPRVIWELGVWPRESAIIKILEQVEVRLYRA
ncbi:MAG: colanic acid biosynthesis glycosyl transferase WcaI, partial [Kiritimatiellia bacterium]